MRAVAGLLSLLALGLVSADPCLDEAVAPSARQNLVNPNGGETYPVGFFISEYAASFAANILAATLVEEILGYNIKLNMNDLGSGSVAGYYGVTGCRQHSNPADRGCMQGATEYHVHLESWQVYPVDWTFIQRSYTSMAPKNLGSSGYQGLSTAYLPKPAQQQAYATSGTAIEFYRNWNISWNQPWIYFGNISGVDSTLLMKCTESVMSDDGAMRRHVQFTGDADGVVITNDTYAGNCVDSKWWLPPSCRGNVYQCVPYLSGGNGWGIEEMMQKTTIFSMPMALAVAASWGDYTTLPLSGEITMYWWTPDPTFLDLSPMALKFPPYNAAEFARNIQTSEAAAANIDTLVSRDLEILAPVVERFADLVEIPLPHMENILKDHKNKALDNSESSWRNVTCEWLRANRALWESWIPDESKCFPGFGLYDSVLKEYTNDRNSTNAIVCQACRPGSFSQKLVDGGGVTHVCVPCAAGTSQLSGASLACKPCKAGEYQDEPGKMECKRCDAGLYQDLTGQLGCKACPATTNTLGPGAVSEKDCGCDENFIDMDRTGAYNCVPCGEGMTCPALSQLVDLERGASDVGEEFVPQINSGYFSTKNAPTEIFRCGGPTTCPGGTPGSCSGGLINTPCSQCPEGATWTGSSCEDCSGWRQVLWVLVVIGIFFAWTLAYYLSTSKVTAKATVLFATTASFGLLVMSMQNMGLIGMMTVEWPLNLRGIFSICQFLLLDIDSYGFSCIAGQSEPIRYLLSALIFPVGLTWLSLCFGISKLFAEKYHWSGPKVLSTMGAFLQVSFSTMSATALSPMMCYKHPNGLRSILKYPGVLCGSSDHAAMLVVAWILLTVFVLGFPAACTFAVLKAPYWSSNDKYQHRVAAIRFLVFRFRMDVWWFGVPLLLRGPLINLPVVLATDYPPIQVVCIAMILTTMMVLQMLSWPWKVPMLNLTDCIVSVCIVLLVTTSTLYLNKIDETMYTFASIVTTAMLSGIAVALVVMMLMTMSALIYRSAMGGRKELVSFNLGSLPPTDELGKKVKEMSEELQKMDVFELSKQLSALSVFDLNKVTTAITLLATEVAPPEEDAVSYTFNSRIAAGSFDAALIRKTHSLPRKTEAVANQEVESEKEDHLKTGWI